MPKKAERSGKPSGLTVSVPEAGKRWFNLGRDASYAAAARGDLPTFEFGKLKRCSVQVLDRMLETGEMPGKQK